MTANEQPESIIGRERALIDALSTAIYRSIGGRPPSRATQQQMRLHNAGEHFSETRRGRTFLVQVVGPDRLPTGHIARVTVELDHFDRS